MSAIESAWNDASAGEAVELPDVQSADEQVAAAGRRVIDLRGDPNTDSALPKYGFRAYRALGLARAATEAACVIAAFVISTVLLGPAHALRPLEVALALLIWIAVLHVFGLHEPHRFAVSEELTRMISASSLASLLVVTSGLTTGGSIPRSWLALTWIAATLLLLATRGIWRALTSRLMNSGVLGLRTLVVGPGEETERLAASLQSANQGFIPVACVDSDGHPPASGLPRVSLSEIEDGMVSHRIDCLFVDARALDPNGILYLLQAARRHQADIRVCAHVPDILTSRLALQAVGSIMSISLRPSRSTRGMRASKRAFDLIVGGAALVLSLPLLSLAALVVRLTSSGPAIFRHERVTAGGRPFTMYKLRTMVPDADRILQNDAVDTTVPFFKSSGDALVTPIGRILRKWSIDELPQLLNVLRGDMSLVGPRPLSVDQVRANLDLLAPRHEIKAGMTGWWQVSGRSDLDIEESLRMDLFYIKNWSLSLDLYILLKTIGALVSRRGAY